MEELNKEITRKKFKQWFMLDELKGNILDCIHSGDNKFSEYIIEYVRMAFDLEDSTMLSELPWWEIAVAFERASLANLTKLKLPMLLKKGDEKKKDIKEVTYAWDYPERTWYFILHQFIYNYGWTIDTVENLDVDDALALLQEINISDQLNKEFYYSISEIAYPYDEARKLNVFKPMERPEWMKEFVKVLPPKKVKILKSMMPVGLIIGSPKNDIEH